MARAARTAVAALAALATVPACRGDRAGAALPVPGETAPRVAVEVLNAGAQPGAAKLATRLLRRAGIDVVMFGNGPATLGALDSTRIVLRRDAAGVGTRIRRALGVGRVAVQLDSARLLDASVLLGADFQPRRLEFHP